MKNAAERALSGSSRGRSALRISRQSRDTGAQLGDKLGAVRQMRFFCVEDLHEAALLERQHVNSIRLRINTCRIANDVDEPVKRMQAPEEIIVFPIGARQECGEMAE